MPTFSISKILCASVSGVILFTSACLAADSKFGVALVPKMTGGDTTESQLFEIVGQMPEIDRVYAINDGNHMLRTLAALKTNGQIPNHMVICGHGSRATPGIKWAADDMIPEEVDLAWNEQQLHAADRAIKNPHLTTIKPATLQQKRQEFSEHVSLLKQAHGLMAENGVVLLINCSAAATPKGRKFVQDLGELLLGENGGTIIASRSDININLRSSVLQRRWTQILNGEMFEHPEYLVQADWEAFPIAGKKTAGTAWKNMVGLWLTDSGLKVRITCSPSNNELTGVIESVPADNKYSSAPGSFSFKHGVVKTSNSIHSDKGYCYPKRTDKLAPADNCPMDLVISADGNKITGRKSLAQYYDGSTTWDAGVIERPVSWTRIGK